MNDLFQNENFIELILTLIGIALTVLKTTELYKRHLKEKYDLAISCLEAGVKQVQDEYVDDLKKASEDGKLTEEEKLAAKNNAINKAAELGGKVGVDVVRTLGADFLNSLIAKKVREIK